MQKLSLLRAGCKKEAFREGSCVLFSALQTAFGEHLFTSHLVKCSFFSIFWMLLKWNFPTPPLHFKLVEATPEENAPGHFWIEHLVGRQNWNPKFAPCLKKETEKETGKAGIVLNPLQTSKTASEGALSLSHIAVSWLRLIPYTGACNESLCYLPHALWLHCRNCSDTCHQVPEQWLAVTSAQNPTGLDHVMINGNIFWLNTMKTVLLMPK